MNQQIFFFNDNDKIVEVKFYNFFIDDTHLSPMSTAVFTSSTKEEVEENESSPITGYFITTPFKELLTELQKQIWPISTGQIDTFSNIDTIFPLESLATWILKEPVNAVFVKEGLPFSIQQEMVKNSNHNISYIRNPDDKIQQLHNMLWRI